MLVCESDCLHEAIRAIACMKQSEQIMKASMNAMVCVCVCVCVCMCVCVYSHGICIAMAYTNTHTLHTCVCAYLAAAAGGQRRGLWIPHATCSSRVHSKCQRCVTEREQARAREQASTRCYYSLLLLTRDRESTPARDRGKRFREDVQGCNATACTCA